MSYSLNEIEAVAKRATRGAGYPWGLAEDAAKATRWLCAQGLDGCASLARVLDRGFAGSRSAHAPRDLGGEWTANDTLCPLLAGTALSDSGSRLRAGDVVLGPVAEPLMLVPFVASAARALDRSLTLDCVGTTAVSDGNGVHLCGVLPDLAERVCVHIDGVPGPRRAPVTRATPDPEAFSTLNHFASLTYAPSTEESRMRGAGAGLSDND